MLDALKRAVKNNRIASVLLTLGESSLKALAYRRSGPSSTFLPAEKRAILEQLRKNGLVILPGYYSEERCAELRSAIDDAIAKHPESVCKDEEGSDHRLFGFERFHETVQEFHSDPFFHALSEAYHRCSILNAFTLAGRLECRAGNRGSGGGWHRDSFGRQFKSIVYLSDVDECHGPFQYLKHSAQLGKIVRHIWRARLGYRKNRLSDEQVSRILEVEAENLVTATGSVESLVLMDPRGIHRGMPIAEGCRYALTNYYFAALDVTQSLVDHFNAHVKMVDGNPLMVAEIRAFRAAEPSPAPVSA